MAVNIQKILLNESPTELQAALLVVCNAFPFDVAEIWIRAAGDPSSLKCIGHHITPWNGGNEPDPLVELRTKAAQRQACLPELCCKVSE